MLTRERVNVLFQANLVRGYVFFNLVSNVIYDLIGPSEYGRSQTDCLE